MWDYPTVGGSSREGIVISGSNPLLSTGSQTPRIESNGALHVGRGRGGAQGEEEDTICRAGLCAHQPGPPASGDGEQAMDRLLSDP